MAFKPVNEQHAVAEMVFGLALSRNFTAAELESIVGAHDRWKADLPKLSRGNVFEFIIGEGPPPPEGFKIVPPVGGVMFDAIKKDGGLEWRLRAEGNGLFVNCLAYTRWREVWGKAREYLSRASEVGVGDDNPIKSVVLQYIDVFEWEGDLAKYALDGLLQKGSRFIPSSAWNRGPLWHLHQGWFEEVKTPAPGRRLERLHLDASFTKATSKHTVKVDTYLQYDLATPVATAVFFAGDTSPAEQFFDHQHEVSKGIVRDLLHPEMQKRIALNA